MTGEQDGAMIDALDNAIRAIEESDLTGQHDMLRDALVRAYRALKAARSPTEAIRTSKPRPHLSQRTGLGLPPPRATNGRHRSGDE